MFRTKLWVAAMTLAFLGRPTATMAGPIDLVSGDITKLTYIGYETFHNVVGVGAVVPGDYFDGIFKIQTVTNPSGSVDLSGQLAGLQLTGAFRFTVTGGSSTSGHLEFGLNPGDDFSLYIEGAGVNAFDPPNPNAHALARSGTPWLSLRSGSFFDSVNDVIDGAPLNRTWADVAANATGDVLGSEPFPTLLGKNPLHTYGGMTRGDELAQLYFENHSALSDVSGYTYRINGEVYIESVPEPSSLALTGLACLPGLACAWRRYRRDATARATGPDGMKRPPC